MSTDTTLFDQLETAPEPYSIMARAAEIAEREGIDVAEAQGRLVEHHQYKIWQVIEQAKVERASLRAKVERLRNELEVAEFAAGQLDRRIEHETEHDRMVLAAYVAEAEQFQNARGGKTHQFAWGPIQQRTKTTRATAVKQPGADEALIRQYPEFTQTVFAWGEFKKTLGITDGGLVFDADGQVVPPELVEGRAKASEETFSTRINGVAFDLMGGLQDGDDSDYTGSDAPADALGEDFDPFAE